LSLTNTLNAVISFNATAKHHMQISLSDVDKRNHFFVECSFESLTHHGGMIETSVFEQSFVSFACLRSFWSVVTALLCTSLVQEQVISPARSGSPTGASSACGRTEINHCNSNVLPMLAILKGGDGQSTHHLSRTASRHQPVRTQRFWIATWLRCSLLQVWDLDPNWTKYR